MLAGSAQKEFLHAWSGRKEAKGKVFREDRASFPNGS